MALDSKSCKKIWRVLSFNENFQNLLKANSEVPNKKKVDFHYVVSFNPAKKIIKQT
jgi:hypothetical protein